MYNLALYNKTLQDTMQCHANSLNAHTPISRSSHAAPYQNETSQSYIHYAYAPNHPIQTLPHLIPPLPSPTIPHYGNSCVTAFPSCACAYFVLAGISLAPCPPPNSVGAAP